MVKPEDDVEGPEDDGMVKPGMTGKGPRMTGWGKHKIIRPEFKLGSFMLFFKSYVYS